jgi:lipopolysaccharide/colanic/teichoic acid biosynthesis glycosyltransferase
LRHTRIDELPQLINILRGEMAFVGPRPERPEFVESFTEQIPLFPLRHAIRPGVTGWAQVRLGYTDGLEGARQKLAYDLYYIKHFSPLFDLSIILRTVRTCVARCGR